MMLRVAKIRILRTRKWYFPKACAYQSAKSHPSQAGRKLKIRENKSKKM
jgi:hypothetical protein